MKTMQSIKQAAVDWPTVLRTLAGGGLLGAGVGATTTLLNHLHTLQAKARQSQNPEADDNVVYLNLQPGGLHKAAHSNNAATFALSGLGGLAGTYAAYNLVREMHQNLRKKQLQKELEQSQQIYLDTLGGRAKLAGEFSLMSKGVGSAYLMALLAAMGSGVVTNRILQKQFPPIKDPNRDRPKRIVIRSAPPEPAPAPEESPEATEALLRTQLGNSKAAAASGFADLVNFAAMGKCAQIREVLSRPQTHNVALLMRTVAGARRVKTSSVHRNLALSWLAYDPLVSQSIRPLLAAEFYDWGGGLTKLSSYLDREDRAVGDALVGIAQEVTRSMRQAAYAPVLSRVKSAGPGSLPGPFKAVFMADAVRKLMESNQDGELTANGHNNIPASQDSPSLVDHLAVEDPDAEQFVQQNQHLLESALRQAA